MKHDPDALKTLLGEWTEVPGPAGNLLAESVRRRIDQVDAKSAWLRLFAAFFEETEGFLSKPRGVAAVVALGFVLGVALAEMNVRLNNLRNDGEMSVRYLSLLDSSNR